MSPQRRALARMPPIRMIMKEQSPHTQLRKKLTMKVQMVMETSSFMECSRLRITYIYSKESTMEKVRPVATQVMPLMRRWIPGLSLQYRHWGRIPHRERKQGRYRNRAESTVPRNPSIRDPKQMPTLMMEPGNKKANGTPSQNCSSSISPSQRKFAQKQAKIVLIGPTMKQPTKQKTKVQTYLLSGQNQNQTQRRKQMTINTSTALRPKIQLKFVSRSRSLDFIDIFFLVQISMYSEITAPTTKQKVMDPMDLSFKKMMAVEMVMISFAGLLLTSLKF